jgi:hypothetical protein
MQGVISGLSAGGSLNTWLVSRHRGATRLKEDITDVHATWPFPARAFGTKVLPHDAR